MFHKTLWALLKVVKWYVNDDGQIGQFNILDYDY